MKPLLTEYTASPWQDEGWTTEWYCQPPELKAGFQVVREEWADDYTVRRIFEIKLTESKNA